MEVITDKKDTEDDHYKQKLFDIQKIEDEEKKRIEQEIDDERDLGHEQIEEEAKQKRDESLRPFEKRLNDFKKRGLGGEDEYAFQDMLTDYGKHVENVDEAMKSWK